MLLKLQVSLREKIAYELLMGTALAIVLEAICCSLVQNLGSDVHGVSCISRVCGYIRGKKRSSGLKAKQTCTWIPAQLVAV